MKMYIVGSVGSGKTTLARKLSAHFGVPHYETDNFVWSRHPDGDLRNSIEVRDGLFLQAVRSSSWVIEGVHIDWNEEGFKQADSIVFWICHFIFVESSSYSAISAKSQDGKSRIIGQALQCLGRCSSGIATLRRR